MKVQDFSLVTRVYKIISEVFSEHEGANAFLMGKQNL